jgi:hypothetical protein
LALEVTLTASFTCVRDRNLDWINMSTQVKAPLSSGEVYGVLIGLGGAFALGKCS